MMGRPRGFLFFATIDTPGMRSSYAPRYQRATNRPPAHHNLDAGVPQGLSLHI
jgi:hypothetical protein